jgi:double-strand break repair protein MRE11
MDDIRILITTDNHLGFKEKDTIRGEDSFKAFEDVLDIPSRVDVDLILILGDLFHEANTTLSSIDRCMSIMQQKVGRMQNYGNVLDLENLDPLKMDFNTVPVVIIHGNHDPPIGELKTGSLDLLEKAGYLKYIGKFFQYDNLSIEPFIIKKGKFNIGVYSLGNLKDTLLNFFFREGRIKFVKNHSLDYKILMIHQNRYRGSKNGCPSKNCFDIGVLPPKFFDLILWGHEHQSYTELIRMDEFDLHVYQPGSSIPTSLSMMEAVEKHVGILTFTKKGYVLAPIRINFQRKMFVEEFALKDLMKGVSSGTKPEEVIRSHLITKFMLKEELDKAKLPLIRVKIFMTESEQLNPIELEFMFDNLVANKK